MFGTYLVACLGFPLLLCGLSLGCGLLVRTITGGALRPILVLPVGAAVCYVVTNLLTGSGSTAVLAGPATAVLAGLGLLTARSELGPALGRRRIGGDALWPALGALAVFLVIAAPEIFSGEPTFSGFQHIVDTAHQFSLGAQLATAGRVLPAAVHHARFSSYDETVGEFISSGYPGGGQSLLGSLARLIGVDQAWLWQSFLAFVGAMGALAAYRLVGLVIAARPLRALGSGIALQANVLYGYTLAGGIKELSSAVFLLLVAATAADWRPAPGRRALPIALALSAAFASFNLTILPWLAVLLAGVAATSLLSALGVRLRAPGLQRVRRMRSLKVAGPEAPPAKREARRSRAAWRPMLPWAAGWLETGALVALLSISTLAAASKLFVETSGSVAAQLGLGNLAAAVPNWAAAGVWITGDHRFPLTAHKTVTYACIVLALVLGGIGVAHALRRRRWTLLWLALAGAISLLYVAERYPAWIQFKAECVTSPIALLLAFAGAAAIFQARRLRGLRFVGLLGALVLAAAVLWGNALAYHDTTIAPYPRLHELEVIGQHFAGDGPTLSPSWDEYAEYFLRSMNAEVPPDITYIAPRPGIFLPGQVIYNFDLDQIQLNNVEYFRYLVLRRSPVASRPPSNFVLVERTAFYEVWKRVGNGSSIVLHSPLSGSPTERTASFCRIESRQAKAALKGQVAGARIAYVRTPAAVTLGAAQLSHSATLKVTGDQFIAYGPARAQGAFTVTHAGRWTFWLGGSIERPVRLLVDGRTLGTVAYEASYPGQYVIAGMRRLRAGVHTVELLRGGGSLHPASGNGTDTTNRLIGPLVAMGTPPEEDQPVQTAPFSQLPAICRAHVGLDWLEVLRPAR